MKLIIHNANPSEIKTRKFLSIIESFNIQFLSNEYTSVTSTTSKCIDNVLTNTLNSEYKSDN